MSDYISKSAIVDRLSDAAVNAKEIEQNACANASTYYAGIKCGFWNAAIIADNFPTIDAVPVVRCKDCKYKGWAFVKGEMKLVCDNENGLFRDVQMNDFCSAWERSEE